MSSHEYGQENEELFADESSPNSKRVQELQEQLAATSEKLAATSEKLTASESDREKTSELRDGTYYSVVDEIMTTKTSVISADAISNIARKDEYKPYSLAIDAAKKWKEGDDIATESGRSHYNATSLTTDGMDDGTARRQAKKLKTTMINGMQSDAAQIAHCLPYATGCSSFAGPLIAAAAGVTFNDRAHERQQALIHGVLKKKTTKKGGVRYQRCEGTGVKHYRDNMARILHQALYCDKKPSVLILPILELRDVLNPPLEYSALVVCRSPQIYKEMVLTDEYELCSHDEIKLAIGRLHDFMGGAGLCLYQKTEAELDDIMDKGERNLVSATWRFVTSSKNFPDVEPVDLNDVRVMKVTFSNDDDESKHSWIDPWLLLLKNAIMRSDMSGLKLLPSCAYGSDQEEEQEQEGYYFQEAAVPEYIFAGSISG